MSEQDLKSSESTLNHNQNTPMSSTKVVFLTFRGADLMQFTLPHPVRHTVSPPAINEQQVLSIQNLWRLFVHDCNRSIPPGSSKMYLEHPFVPITSCVEACSVCELLAIDYSRYPGDLYYGIDQSATTQKTSSPWLGTVHPNGKDSAE